MDEDRQLAEALQRSANDASPRAGILLVVVVAVAVAVAVVVVMNLCTTYSPISATAVTSSTTVVILEVVVFVVDESVSFYSLSNELVWHLICAIQFAMATNHHCQRLLFAFI